MVRSILVHQDNTRLITHYTHEERSHLSRFGDVCFITIRQKLKKILIKWRFLHFYSLSMDISVTIQEFELKRSVCHLNIFLESSMCQNFVGVFFFISFYIS